MKYKIAHKEFNTLKEMYNFTRDLITELSQGCLFTIGPDNAEYFRELIKRHPNYASKVKNGKVIYFDIRKNQYGKSTLYIKLKDHKELIDISWVKCIYSSEKKNNVKLNAALRQAIQYQITAFKRSRKRKYNICYLCNEKIENIEDTHIDHVIKFKTLVDNFLKITNENIPTTFLEKIGYEFTDSDVDFADTWREFHGENSILAITHAQCNLKRK